MAEFFDSKERVVDVGEPVVFENKTDSSFDVGMGVVFHKSGIYEVSILGNRTVVSKVTERKTGKWLLNGGRLCECSVCHREGNEYGDARFCAYCGAKMKGEENETN